MLFSVLPLFNSLNIAPDSVGLSTNFLNNISVPALDKIEASISTDDNVIQDVIDFVKTSIICAVGGDTEKMDALMDLFRSLNKSNKLIKKSMDVGARYVLEYEEPTPTLTSSQLTKLLTSLQEEGYKPSPNEPTVNLEEFIQKANTKALQEQKAALQNPQVLEEEEEEGEEEQENQASIDSLNDYIEKMNRKALASEQRERQTTQSQSHPQQVPSSTEQPTEQLQKETLQLQEEVLQPPQSNQHSLKSFVTDSVFEAPTLESKVQTQPESEPESVPLVSSTMTENFSTNVPDALSSSQSIKNNLEVISSSYATPQELVTDCSDASIDELLQNTAMLAAKMQLHIAEIDKRLNSCLIDLKEAYEKLGEAIEQVEHQIDDLSTPSLSSYNSLIQSIKQKKSQVMALQKSLNVFLSI